jgi:hypothetical protein
VAAYVASISASRSTAVQQRRVRRQASARDRKRPEAARSEAKASEVEQVASETREISGRGGEHR